MGWSLAMKFSRVCCLFVFMMGSLPLALRITWQW